MRRTTIAMLASALLALFVLPGIAQAAPAVLASDPERDSEVHEAPAEVSITFDMPLDANASKLGVFDECGRRLDAGDLEVLGNKMTVSIEKTPAGLYEMRYVATPPAGATGTSSGIIPFTVHGGTVCGPEAGGHGGHGGNEGNHNGGHGGNGGQGGHNGGHSNHEPGGTAASNQGQHSGHGSGTSATASSGSHTSHSESSMTAAAGHTSGNSGHNHGSKPNKNNDDIIDLTAGVPEVAGIQVENIPMSTGLWALLMCLLLGAAGGYLVRNGIRI